MDLKRILEILAELEADGKLSLRSLPTLYDPNGDITLTVRAADVATREQFLADVAGTVDEAAPVAPVKEDWKKGLADHFAAHPEPAPAPHATATVAAKAASKKAAKKK